MPITMKMRQEGPYIDLIVHRPEARDGGRRRYGNRGTEVVQEAVPGMRYGSGGFTAADEHGGAEPSLLGA